MPESENHEVVLTLDTRTVARLLFACATAEAHYETRGMANVAERIEGARNELIEALSQGVIDQIVLS